MSLNQVELTNYQLSHGILSSAAWVIFFPLGAIILRIWPNRFTLFTHATCQIFAYVLFIVGTALGIKCGLILEAEDAGILKKYHPVIGLVIFALVFFMPALGLAHHKLMKKFDTRTIWSHLHIWGGRVLVTLGIINGGLGMLLAAPYQQPNIWKGYVGYSVVAAIMYTCYVLSAIYGKVIEIKTANTAPNSPSDSDIEEGRNHSVAYEKDEAKS